MQVTKHASEGIHPDFETQGRRHQKSKTGISGPTKRIDVLQIFFFLKSLDAILGATACLSGKPIVNW